MLKIENNQKNMYHVAAYLRLSRDDEDMDGSTKQESNSISSQRELIRSFIREQEDMMLFHTYVDDGYSGASFDRPGLKRMMADIEAGKVNCVIVKDLSRLGRDYIEAGRLIQKTFPAFHVRFIALTDHFDSQTADHNTKSLILPVKNFINDSYCRDISQKVKSSQRVKREQGKFIGAFAVYGYRKCAEDKNRLCPDDYAADIVRKIFAWKMDGMSSLAISQKLNESGALSPVEYKKLHGEKFSTSFQTNPTAKWSAVAVKRILSDEVYTGTLVQGKREQVNFKLKKTLVKPKEEWVRVEDTHEAIVSRSDFALVQDLLSVDTRAKSGANCAHLFSGMLFCGDCKEPMIRRINRYKEKSKIYFICQTKNKGKGCTRHSILEKELKDVVFQVLQTYVAVFLDTDSQLAHIQNMEINLEEVERIKKEIDKLYKERNKYQYLRAGLYEDLKTGLITETDFQSFGGIYEKQCNGIQSAIEKQEEIVTKLLCNDSMKAKRESLKKMMKLTNISRDELLCFISRIEVYEGKKIYIKFRAREEVLLQLQVQTGGD